MDISKTDDKDIHLYRLSRFASRMSAFGGKADVNHGLAELPLIAISGHSDTRLPTF